VRPRRRDRHDQTAELELLRAALAGAGDLAYSWDLASDRLTWSGRLNEIFGLTTAAEIDSGGALDRLIDGDDRRARRRLLDEHIAEGKPFDCEYRVATDGGDTVWVHERGTAVLGADGKAQRIAGTLRIITARKVNEARLEYRAHYDELTGHFNQARLREALEQAMAYSRRYGTEGAYLEIRLDTLSMIHDAYDAETADAMLLTLGHRIEHSIRDSDVVGRIAGDTFGVVLSNCPGRELGVVGLKLIAEIQDKPVETASGPIHLNISIGAGTFPEAGQSAHDVMAQADIACREAHDSQGLPFVRYQYSERQRSDNRRDMTVAEKVVRALKTKRLVFAYQPIVDARDWSVEHYECLVRMIEADDEVVAAAHFMPVIERLGLVREVDRYVLETAVRQLHDHHDLTFAINVSALTASDRSWLRLLFALLRNAPHVAERLIVEITETVALRDVDETAEFVARVRDLGCRVALDDFGAGYTSFRHLKSLAVDSVKIDGAFVRGVAGNIDNQLFVRTLLGLAKGFQLRTIAECVETEGDAEVLAKQGVDCLQGYFFGRPSIEPPWSDAAVPALAPVAAAPGRA
jgi:diguanylate cyclase (GGDEF)-like protein/PAS domain S-box-containing protein